MDEVKKLCTSLRRNAKEERVLFHYNGHGVPRPTVNGEIWVFNKVGAPQRSVGAPPLSPAAQLRVGVGGRLQLRCWSLRIHGPRRSEVRPGCVVGSCGVSSVSAVRAGTGTRRVATERSSGGRGVVPTVPSSRSRHDLLVRLPCASHGDQVSQFGECSSENQRFP